MDIDVLTDKEKKLVENTQPKIREAMAFYFKSGFSKDEKKIKVARERLRKIIQPSVRSGLELGLKWLKG